MSTQEDAERRQQLKSVAEAYFRGLQQQDFAAIPYDEDVTLRAPLAPGGVNRPLVDKAALRTEWWQPLEPALTGLRVRILDHYINETSTAIVTEAEATITALDPPLPCEWPTGSRRATTARSWSRRTTSIRAT